MATAKHLKKEGLVPTLNVNLLYPMFAMFVLSVYVLVRMFLSRVNAIKSGQLKINYFKTYTETNGPEAMLQASRHFSNLFEAPVLFYVVCILGMILSEGLPFLILAWLYVLARVVHAYIHLGRNKVIHRMRAYGFSWLFLTCMWLLLVFHQLFPPAI